ncbi:MAG: hypothetical protein KIT72_09520 [Polyangiaceae bacterium]|nr:hypothetical protein [Polyangiaceae bacterium]MCW5790646.1 hypothetical protein [Polyangiaceae bacterium]
MGFTRDPSHWLLRLSPEEWIQAGLVELRRAEGALHRGQLAPGYAGLKRAAGMALNAALITQPRDAWGRTYVEHLTALEEDLEAPSAVREAAGALRRLKAGSGTLINLRTPSSEARWVEAAKTVMAHGYALTYGSSRADEVSREPDGAPSAKAPIEVSESDEASSGAWGAGGSGPLLDNTAEKESP